VGGVGDRESRLQGEREGKEMRKEKREAVIRQRVMRSNWQRVYKWVWELWFRGEKFGSHNEGERGHESAHYKSQLNDIKIKGVPMMTKESKTICSLERQDIQTSLNKISDRDYFEKRTNSHYMANESERDRSNSPFHNGYK
jgi:hypothetical protein